MKEKQNLLYCDGRPFAAIIRGFPVRGKVYVENENVYLCQDVFSNELKDGMYGYAHLYHVHKGSEKNLIEQIVQDFAIYPETAEEVEEFFDWHVGDILVKSGPLYEEVIFRSGKFVACKAINNNVGLIFTSTCEDLYKLGWRLKTDTPEEIEISMADIRREFGFPPNKKITIKN